MSVEIKQQPLADSLMLSSTNRLKHEILKESSYHDNSPKESNMASSNMEDNGVCGLRLVSLTPTLKTPERTVILIQCHNDSSELFPEANNNKSNNCSDSRKHRNLIINKDVSQGMTDVVRDLLTKQATGDVSLEFVVFLVNSRTMEHRQESRCLRFWLQEASKDQSFCSQVTQDFFKELVNPTDFPRDYTGFIMKVIRLLQHGYEDIQLVEMEFTKIHQDPPPKPVKIASDTGNDLGNSKQVPNVSLKEQILEQLEDSYPNPLKPADVARVNGWSEAEVQSMFNELQKEGLINCIHDDQYSRIHYADKEIRVYKQKIPALAASEQPTIAIITFHYAEKLAVDAMLDNKETFVRYTNMGESNVCTLGHIGPHRIVTTKLPSMSGKSTEAVIAASSVTTRLLGTFQKVAHVIVMGIAGGVPHFTDYRKHVRLGDVVISYSNPISSDKQQVNSSVSREKPFIYVYKTKDALKTFYPADDCLLKIGEKLCNSAEQQQQTPGENVEARRPWEKYLQDALNVLQKKTEFDFKRPDATTDKLYLDIDNEDVIEISHPIGSQMPKDSFRLHLGAIGGGSATSMLGNTNVRLDFAKKYGLLATDTGMNTILEAIIGNCRDSFILVKGIADYNDGTTNRKWQYYASLTAASVVKAIICNLKETSTY